ncbi:MAG: stage III sporulation protein AB [Bacillota bacterium]
MIAGCSGIGLAVAGEYRRRPEELRSWRTALQVLETEISYALSPLTSAMQTAACHAQRPVANVLQESAIRLQERQAVSVAQAWEVGMEAERDRSALLPNDRAILLSLCAALGRSDRSEQQKHLRLAMERLAQAEEAARRAAEKNGRLWSYLGPLTGILVALILI